MAASPPPMGWQPWMEMMTWGCLVLHRLQGLHQQDRAGQDPDPQQPQILVGAAKIGKLLLEKPLDEAGAARSRSAVEPNCALQVALRNHLIMQQKPKGSRPCGAAMPLATVAVELLLMYMFCLLRAFNLLNTALTCSLAHSHPPTHPLTHPPIHSPTHPSTHPPPHSLTHSFSQYLIPPYISLSPAGLGKLGSSSKGKAVDTPITPYCIHPDIASHHHIPHR